MHLDVCRLQVFRSPAADSLQAEFHIIISIYSSQYDDVTQRLSAKVLTGLVITSVIIQAITTCDEVINTNVIVDVIVTIIVTCVIVDIIVDIIVTPLLINVTENAIIDDDAIVTFIVDCVMIHVIADVIITHVTIDVISDGIFGAVVVWIACVSVDTTSDIRRLKTERLDDGYVSSDIDDVQQDTVGRIFQHTTVVCIGNDDISA